MSIDEKLLELLDIINTEQNFGGLVPISSIVKIVKEKFNISLKELQTIILELEKKELIYLEAINDPGRLTAIQLKSAIEHEQRGTLYYIGRW